MLCYFWMRKMIMNRKAKVVCSTRYIQHPINCWGSFRTRDLLISSGGERSWQNHQFKLASFHCISSNSRGLYK